MEIYKLSDKIEEGEVNQSGGGRRSHAQNDDFRICEGGGEELVITELRQGVRDENRVNVFVNGKYALSLDIAQVVELGVKVGRKLSEEELAELVKASEYGKLYQRTLEWVLMRPRSVREVREYLSRKLRMSSSDTFLRARRHGAQSLLVRPVGRTNSSEDNSELCDTVLTRLIDKGYLDDRKFAEFWVENRFVKKGVSKKRLMMELMQKGVAKEIIDEVLSGRDDEAELKKMIARKRAKYDDEKLIAYLCRQGFDYGTVRELVAETRND